MSQWTSEGVDKNAEQLRNFSAGQKSIENLVGVP
jgi:hypothetical protein